MKTKTTKTTHITQTHVRFDWAIKKILRSKANFGILEGFLSELLGKDIKILEIIESESNKETETDKFNRVDINVKDSNGELYIVEIQNTRELDYLYKILYNASKAISENMQKGMRYRESVKVITVSIVYFDIGQGTDYIYHGLTKFTGIHTHDELKLSETQQKLFHRHSVESIFPDHYIIKVNDFDGEAKNTLDQWVYFLKNSVIKDEFDAKGLKEAREILKEINMSAKERAAYNRYIEVLRMEAGVAETIVFETQVAREEGLKEGLKEGERNKALEIAREMKENGMSLEVISKFTRLDLEMINNL